MGLGILKCHLKKFATGTLAVGLLTLEKSDDVGVCFSVLSVSFSRFYMAVVMVLLRW